MGETMGRRRFLQMAAAGGVGATVLGRSSLVEALTATAAGPCPPASLADIDHIVIFIQENRSFDNYFGAYKGVRGFDDRTAPGGVGAFRQAYRQPAQPTGIPNPMLPFRMDTTVTAVPHQGQCTNDVEHQWAGAHDSWNGGASDNWMNSHLATEADPRQAAVTMSYYQRADLPFYYTLADHFTVCDNYFCSVIGGTDQNRLYSITGTIDPDGWDGGCTFFDTKVGTVQTPGADLGAGGRWVPYPQMLSRAGISWKVYGTPDGQLGDNVLRYFPQFRPAGGDPSLSVPAFGSNSFPADFAADCQAGTLPQVSWLLADLPDTEHAPAPVEWGESIVHTVLSALVTSGVWSRSVMFLTYDENGGFFDHVPPPTAPPGTPGEYMNQAALTSAARKEATTVGGVDMSHGPIGLGYRVPTLVVSPFSRNPDPSGGPLVCSDRFDHTSLLRFVETWSQARGHPARIPGRDPSTRSPGLSAWRRQAVGDLTSPFSFGAQPDASVPTAVLAVVPNRVDPAVLTQCVVTGTVGSESSGTEPIVQDPVVPTTAAMPAQERLVSPVRRPQLAACATGTSAVPVGAGTGSGPGGASGSSGTRGSLPATGGLSPLSAGGLLGLGAVAALALRRRLGPGPAPRPGQAEVQPD
ncbi:MAG TPA: alkaline phosphatase family protein [Acidimicrobiales bacterium]|nr:alkaline phosphatase family protein [Acidimicrobiales bacterium]